MSINKHTLWHGIRTVSTGLFMIGLIPLFFLFTGPVDFAKVNMYFIYLAVTLSGIIIGQIMTLKYKQFADLSGGKKKSEKIYGIIGISVILLFFVPFIAMGILSQFSQ